MLAIETFRLKIQFFGFVLAKCFTESATSNFRVGEVQSISVFSQCVQNFHFDALQVLLLGKKVIIQEHILPSKIKMGIAQDS